MSVPVGQTLQNRYVITGLLGHGGMGAVYLATDHRLGVQCAVKETLYTDRSALARFEREAKLLAMLRHPHLPRVTDYFAETGRYYLVMDYVPGLSAEEWVKRNGAVPETQALRWAHDLLDALAYLHARTPPVVHRDIKPANVKITPDDRAVLVDFGIAKEWAAGPGTASQSIAISPEYSPPEQYLGQTDTRTDIYSLGATLYFLLATRLPPTSMARAMGTPVQPCGPSVSPQTEQAIRCAMEMSPEQRWQTAAEMRRALQGAVTPVIPAPARGPAPSARVPPKAQSPATRQSAPSLAGIMAVAVVALIVVGVVSVIALSASGASGGDRKSVV